MYVTVSTHRTTCTIIHTYVHEGMRVHAYISTSETAGTAGATGAAGRLLALALLARALRAPGRHGHKEPVVVLDDAPGDLGDLLDPVGHIRAQEQVLECQDFVLLLLLLLLLLLTCRS